MNTISKDERSYLDRVIAVLTEIGTLRDDLAELKDEALKGALALPPERVGDLFAIARLAVMDEAKRRKRDIQEQRRADLMAQLDLFGG